VKVNLVQREFFPNESPFRQHPIRDSEAGERGPFGFDTPQPSSRTGRPIMTTGLSVSVPETENTTEIRALIERVRAAVGQMRYGQVVIHVRGGVVTQIERSERTRLLQAPGR
jgi:hypothetical protein